MSHGLVMDSVRLAGFNTLPFWVPRFKNIGASGLFYTQHPSFPLFQPPTQAQQNPTRYFLWELQATVTSKPPASQSWPGRGNPQPSAPAWSTVLHEWSKAESMNESYLCVDSGFFSMGTSNKRDLFQTYNFPNQNTLSIFPPPGAEVQTSPSSQSQELPHPPPPAD